MTFIKDAYSALREKAQQRAAKIAEEDAQRQRELYEYRQRVGEETQRAYDQLFQDGHLTWRDFPLGSNVLAVNDEEIIDGKISTSHSRLKVAKRLHDNIHVFLDNRPSTYPEVNLFGLQWTDDESGLTVAQWVAEGNRIDRYEYNGYHREMELRQKNSPNHFSFDPNVYEGQYTMKACWPEGPTTAVKLTINASGIYAYALKENVLQTTTFALGIDSQYDRRVGLSFI